jgi:UDP-N-acetylmuramyl pentapeptide phosphotransferase/UDP-N-acetylglucosamine-1-phosphate transferase
MQPVGLGLAIAVAAAAGGLASALILVLKPLLVRYLLAHPNARSSHANPTPQGAGFAVIIALLITMGSLWVLWGLPQSGAPLLLVLAGAFGLAVLGLADDARALPVSSRFAGQTLAALVMVFGLPEGFRILPDGIPLLLERALLLLGTVWLINAINFLDGIDWITVAQTVPITLGVAVLQTLGAVPAGVGLLALALLGGMLGFAIFNKHPAQVFLGDAGSLPIGLLLAFLLIFVARADLAAALLLALYTIADATLTLLRRAFNREPIFSAHRSHFYQRAVIRGLTPPQVTARVLLLGLLLDALAISAVIARSAVADLVLLALGAIATATLLQSFTRGAK